jgi:flagellar hook-length control protein FliK
VAAKKSGASQSDDKPGKEKQIDPASTSAHPELLLQPLNIPSQHAPVQNALAQLDADLAKTDAANKTQLSTGPAVAQGASDSTSASLAQTAPAGNPIPSSDLIEDGTISTQVSALGNGSKPEKPAAPGIPPATNGAPRKKEAEPAKSNVNVAQQPVAPPILKQPSPVATNSANRIINTAVPNAPASQEKPLSAPATNVVPVTAPPDASDPSLKINLDSSAESKPVAQSGLINSSATDGTKGVSSRDAASSLKSKSKDSKDSPLTSAQNVKPGFTPPAQVAGVSTSSNAGSNKDFAGLPQASHSSAHAKAEPLKEAGAASSAPALGDADGPDESVPIAMTSGIATAKLVQSANQSEFRVGMQTQEFGNIDIRTSVARHMFSAQISVEHGDMAKSLSAQLPGLYHRLADQQVAVGNIVIQGQSQGTSSGLAQDAQRQNAQPAQGGSVAKPEAEPVLPAITGGIDSAGRLDIRI